VTFSRSEVWVGSAFPTLCLCWLRLHHSTQDSHSSRPCGTGLLPRSLAESFAATPADHRGIGLAISRACVRKGCTLLAFDLVQQSPDAAGVSGPSNLEGLLLGGSAGGGAGEQGIAGVVQVRVAVMHKVD
jgi:hypothetical protein